MRRTYITHVTRDYLDVALNLATSIRLFSNIPLVIYCVKLQNEDSIKFSHIQDVYLRNIDYNLMDPSEMDFHSTGDGNFYVNRNTPRTYLALCIKTIAMQMALEEGWEEVCYLDSDCIATPITDEIFEWSSEISNYPLATEGIHQYMMFFENGIEYGNPFSGGSWPVADNTLTLEWPLMNFLDMKPEQRGSYRTTNVLLMNSNCLEFVKTWRELCFLLPKLVNVRKWAGYHEETIYNVLNWRETNKGLPLCYVNLSDGLDTVIDLYSDSSIEGYLRWSDEDTSRNFYKIPDSKKNIKVLHGEKRKSEVDKILNFFSPKKTTNTLIQIDTFIRDEVSLEITTECIKRVKNLGFSILLTSHLPIPESLKGMVDYHLEDLNNILLPSDGSISFLNFSNQDLTTQISIENSDAHAPACLTSIINGARFAKNHNFKFFVRMEYDAIIKSETIHFFNKLINDSSQKNGFIFGGNEWLDGKIMMLNAEEYLNTFDKNIQTSDDYFNLLKSYDVPKHMFRHLQNVQYNILEKQGLISDITILPVDLVGNITDSKLIDGRRNPGLFRPVYLNDNQFATICHGWNTGEVLVTIYSGEKQIAEYVQNFYNGVLTYHIFEFITGINYKVVAKNTYTLQEDTFEFSTSEQLLKMGNMKFN